MNRPQCIIRVILSAVIILLVSCVDGREEYWVGADGGGRAEITYRLPASVAMMYGGTAGIREWISSFLKDTPAINNSACEVVTEGDFIRVKVRANFNSALDLMDVAKGGSMKKLPSAAIHMAGEVESSISGRTLDLTRKVSLPKAVPACVLLPASALEGRHLVYIMHLPAPVMESNATRTEDGGSTLVWDFPLSQAVRTDLVTRFKMTIPIPWTLVSAVGIVVSVACLTFFLALRARKRKQAQRAASTCDPPVSGSDG